MLDIQGAFNNVRPNAIIGAHEFEVEAYLKHNIYSLLCDSTVVVENGRALRKIQVVCRGILLLWILVLKDLLKELEE